MAYWYRCADYPGLEACPATFTTATEAELWRHLELHAVEAHGEDPDAWSETERQRIRNAIKVV